MIIKNWHYFLTATCIANHQIMPSSVVAAIKYDPASSVLRVIFVSGTIYDYLEVPEKIYKAMKTASSKGTYLNEHIKGHYKFEKVR
jgi:hypothetical protein